MKRGIVCLLCLALLLVGCASSLREESASSVPTEASSAESTALEDSSEESSSGEKPIEQPDELTALGQLPLPEPSELPGICTPTETEHLYACLSDVSSDVNSVQQAGEFLLLSGWETAFLYRISTWELVATYSVPIETWETKLLADGSICCVVKHWEDNGLEVIRYTPGQPDKGETLVQTVSMRGYALSADGTELLTDPEEGLLCLYDLTGKEAVREFSDIRLSYAGLIACEDGFLGECENGGIFRLDKAGEMTFLSLPSFPSQAFGNWYHCFRDSGIFLSDGKENGFVRFLAVNAWEESLEQAAYGYLLTVTRLEDSAEARFYDLRKQTVRSVALPVTGEYLTVRACFLASGQAVFLTQLDGESKLFLYDLPRTSSEEADSCEQLLLGSEEQVGEQTRALAEEIFEQTGIEVLYGSQGNDFILWDYVGAPELDPYVLHGRLQTVADELAKYPEGMLREMHEQTHRGMKFYLCGRLYGVSGNGGLTEAGAVTTEIDGYIVIAFNCNDALAVNIPHELSHACDRRISYVASHGGADWLSEWVSRNEVNDPYTYSYENYWNNTRYTIGEERDPNRVWFVDGYSRTQPTEDRARIMERLFAPECGLEELLTYPHLKDKALLYCEILRDCFPSCAKNTPFWEEALQESNKGESHPET